MEKIDTIYKVETPEGVMLSLRVAGLPARAWAYSIDFLIRWICNIVISIGFTIALGDDFIGLLLIYFFFMEWFYPVFFEIKKQGSTPGKKVMKLKVLHGDGTPVSFQSSCIRNLLLAADFLPFLFGFGILASLLDTRFRRMGDMAADTIVVYDKKISKAQMPEVSAQMPPLPLNLEEQRAVIAFAERSDILSSARLEELAEILSPLHECKTDKGVESIQAYANALAGNEVKAHHD